MSSRFYRGERLKSRKEIERLFSRSSDSVGSYPLRLVFNRVEEPQGSYRIQIAFTVPKRKFKKAVDRNRIRRVCREAFRVNKPQLLAALPTDAPQYALMLIYVGREEMPYRYVERKMRKLNQLFLAEIRT